LNFYRLGACDLWRAAARGWFSENLLSGFRITRFLVNRLRRRLWRGAFCWFQHHLCKFSHARSFAHNFSSFSIALANWRNSSTPSLFGAYSRNVSPWRTASAMAMRWLIPGRIVSPSGLSDVPRSLPNTVFCITLDVTNAMTGFFVQALRLGLSQQIEDLLAGNDVQGRRRDRHEGHV